MLLNSLEIQSQNIIVNAKKENYTESSYNLRIGKIITHEGKILDSIDLAPQGLITVISEEELHIPNSVLGIATVKNGLSQKGVLALNIGLIDSGWTGPINSTIINFGKGTYTLSRGDVFLRITVNKYNKLPSDLLEPITYKPEQYLRKTITDIRAYLGEKFLSLDQTSKEIEKNVETAIWEGIKRLSSLFGLVSVIALIISVSIFIITKVSDTGELNEKIIKLESEKNVQTEKIDILTKKIEDLKQESNKKQEELLKYLQQKNNGKH